MQLSQSSLPTSHSYTPSTVSSLVIHSLTCVGTLERVKVSPVAEMVRSRTMKPPPDKMDVISAEAQTGLRGTADSPENRDGDERALGEMGEIRR